MSTDAPLARSWTRSTRVRAREVVTINARDVLAALGASRARGAGVNVAFEPQVEHWDCGLACALMLVRSAAAQNARARTALRQTIDLATMTRACGTKSVWTIDLAFALSAFGAEASVMFTSFLGVNLEYVTTSFYRDEILRDVKRVEGLFRAASRGEGGVDVRCGRLSTRTVADVCRSGRVACVVLVDKSLLYASEDDADADVERKEERHFVGHYIVVCGVDADRFIIRDPARPDARSVSSRAFDDARRAFGTDDDLIFVNLERFNVERCQRTLARYAVAQSSA